MRFCCLPGVVPGVKAKPPRVCPRRQISCQGQQCLRLSISLDDRIQTGFLDLMDSGLFNGLDSRFFGLRIFGVFSRNLDVRFLGFSGCFGFSGSLDVGCFSDIVRFFLLLGLDCFRLLIQRC